ncbi:MAG: tetratricopeptide repeat protein [bacterium]
MNESLRILSAIMFTDMVGYTALMQSNERHAKDLRDRHRKVLEKNISDHQGRILQYYGDGTLSIFGSAIEAVRAAVEIQKELREEPKISLRIGIHVGDVVYEDEGVYGDGVNLASRIESLSVSGAILISERVYDDIRNQSGLTAISLGSFELKNVRRPIEIYAITNDYLIIPTHEEIKSKTGSSYKSIAVLPFVNMSPDQDNEYFSDGITEEILNALTKVEHLNVTARTSSFQFKGKNLDVREIGNLLNVNTILEGSVRKAGNKVRITAQLISVKDGFHLWSESFDRELQDIFSVQDEIARSIASHLERKLKGTKVNEPLVKSQTSNWEAYNLFLKGSYYWGRWTPDDIEKSISFFEKSIQLEPEFVLPYAALSGCYIYLGATGFMKPDNAYPRGKSFALQALRMDENLANAHIALAMVKFFYDWDWEGVEVECKKAILLNPSYAEAHHHYALFLMAMGRLEEAMQEIEQACLFDPLSPTYQSAKGDIYIRTKRFDEALEQYNKVLENNPDFRVALVNKGWAYYARGLYNEAIELFEEAKAMTNNIFKGITPLGVVYAKLGQKEKVHECLENLKMREKLEKNISLNLDYAIIYGALEDYDRTFEYLEKAFEERNGGILFVRGFIWKGIHDDPRYIDLINRLKFQQ